jgi:hypothetical protein
VVLSSRRSEVTQHLRRIAGPLEEPVALPAVFTRQATRRVLLSLAGAVTILASVVVVHDATSGPSADVPIEVQIGDAVVVTR